jgi:hypothetical protein
MNVESGGAREHVPAVADTLAAIERYLVCPSCRTPLERRGDDLAGTACRHRYPVRDGIARLAVFGTSETWDNAALSSSRAYQDNYQKVDDAAGYNRGYREKATKRLSTRRELDILRMLLATQPRSRRLLNLPSGGGRVSGPLADATDLLIEGDIALGQVLYGASHRKWTTPEVRMTASAFHVPLADRSVDGVVCIRLSHHLPTPVERQRLLSELLRVADRFVVMTFFDYNSVKNVLRRIRPFDRKPPKNTMRTDEVAGLAAARGFALRRCPYLSFFGSGHRYALLVREGAA